MSLPNHLRVEGALAEIIELLTNYEDPSVISYENLFKYPDVEALLYRLLVKHMSQKERQIIEDAIQVKLESFGLKENPIFRLSPIHYEALVH